MYVVTCSPLDGRQPKWPKQPGGQLVRQQQDYCTMINDVRLLLLLLQRNRHYNTI